MSGLKAEKSRKAKSNRKKENELADEDRSLELLNYSFVS